MATITAVVASSDTYQTFFYETMTETDADGTPIERPYCLDWSIQAVGDFGSSGAVSLQGTLDGTNWEVINDHNGNAVTMTAAGISHVQGPFVAVRPAVTAGTSVDVDVTILAHLAKRTNRQ